jgi:putative transposase
VRVPDGSAVSDRELMRRYKVLYPKPAKCQEASAEIMQAQLIAGGDEAAEVRQKLLARMGDLAVIQSLRSRIFG